MKLTKSIDTCFLTLHWIVRWNILSHLGRYCLTIGWLRVVYLYWNSASVVTSHFRIRVVSWSGFRSKLRWTYNRKMYNSTPYHLVFLWDYKKGYGNDCKIVGVSKIKFVLILWLIKVYLFLYSIHARKSVDHIKLIKYTRLLCVRVNKKKPVEVNSIYSSLALNKFLSA